MVCPILNDSICVCAMLTIGHNLIVQPLNFLFWRLSIYHGHSPASQLSDIEDSTAARPEVSNETGDSSGNPAKSEQDIQHLDGVIGDEIHELLTPDTREQTSSDGKTVLLTVATSINICFLLAWPEVRLRSR
jgi:hypothetical protein